MPNQELPLPCIECCLLDQTCCQNPQIAWTLEEVDNLFSAHKGSEILKNLIFFKGEAPGLIYIIRTKKEDIDSESNSVALDYCAMYDQDNRRCSVYNERPNICQTYGDPKYNTCPYTEYREPGAITELVKSNKQLAKSLHVTSDSNILLYLKDFIFPFVDRFKASREDNPEYYKYWENLPEANFIRRQL